MKKIKILLPTLIFATALLSQNTSMKFVELYPTARMESMSVSFVSEEPGCIFKNPAVIYDIKNNLLTFTYNEYIQQMKYNFFSYTISKNHYRFSFGFSSLYSDNIEARKGEKDLDSEYVNLYQITLPDYYYDVVSIQTGCSISKKLNSEIIFGSTGKLLFEKIENVSAYSLAFDLGLKYIPKKFNRINLGLSVNNLGTPSKYIKELYSLPLQFTLAGSFRFRNFYTALEFNYPLFEQKNLYISVGNEITFFEYLFLRFGYKYKPYGWNLEDKYTGISCGVGMNFYGIKLDYSLSSLGEIGVSYKFTLSCEIERITNLYKFLRKKLFSTKEANDKEINHKNSTDILKSKPIETQTRENITSIPQPIPIEENSLSNIIFNIKLLSFDTINKLFIYRVELSSSVFVNSEVQIQNLSFELISINQLQEKVVLDIMISSQPFKTNYGVTLDFTRFKNLGVTRNYRLKITSTLDNLKFYTYKNGQWENIILTNFNPNIYFEYEFISENVEKVLITKNE